MILQYNMKQIYIHTHIHTHTRAHARILQILYIYGGHKYI